MARKALPPDSAHGHQAGKGAPVSPVKPAKRRPVRDVDAVLREFAMRNGLSLVVIDRAEVAQEEQLRRYLYRRGLAFTPQGSATPSRSSSESEMRQLIRSVLAQQQEEREDFERMDGFTQRNFEQGNVN